MSKTESHVRYKCIRIEINLDLNLPVNSLQQILIKAIALCGGGCTELNLVGYLQQNVGIHVKCIIEKCCSFLFNIKVILFNLKRIQLRKIKFIENNMISQ